MNTPTIIPSEDTPAHPMNGAEMVVACLENAGVKNVFAYPGGASIPLHQALSHSNLNIILPRHEQGGGFMAAGFARATGLTSICFATSGPGATNLVTAIADAYADSIPVIFITGQVSTQMIGRNAFQECDFIGITRSIVKHSYLVLTLEELPRIMAEALHLANSGRPGPIVIDIPKNIQTEVGIPNFCHEINIRNYRHKHVLNTEDLSLIRSEITRAQRPCIYAGGGIIAAGASKELIKFAEQYHIPVATTLMGVGAIPDNHPLSLQWLGMHGSYAANVAVNECDLLLAFGVRFDDRVTGDVGQFAKDAKIIHVDIDLSEINKNKAVYHGVLADVKDVLVALNTAPIHIHRAEWDAKIASLRSIPAFSYQKTEKYVQPQRVIETLSNLTDGQAIIVPGVGQHQMFAAQFYNFRYARQLLTSAGLGTMGFGLPTAIGAKIARPDKLVINIDGDGSFQMNIQELATAYAQNVNVKMIILNNQTLGMVAQWEDRFYNSNRANTIMSVPKFKKPYPSFVEIAKGYGIPGKDAWTIEELEPALDEMIHSDSPFLVDVHMPFADHVLPMIPAGKTYKDMIME